MIKNAHFIGGNEPQTLAPIFKNFPNNIAANTAADERIVVVNLVVTTLWMKYIEPKIRTQIQHTVVGRINGLNHLITELRVTAIIMLLVPATIIKGHKAGFGTHPQKTIFRSWNWQQSANQIILNKRLIISFKSICRNTSTHITVEAIVSPYPHGTLWGLTK